MNSALGSPRLRTDVELFNLPSFGIGLLPILYGVSMWAVTAISPQQVQDPMQRRIFQLMPIMFTFMFASFAIGTYSMDNDEFTARVDSPVMRPSSPWYTPLAVW